MFRKQSFLVAAVVLASIAAATVQPAESLADSELGTIATLAVPLGR